jgi:uncharacterized membrane protein (DUF485 family)
VVEKVSPRAHEAYERIRATDDFAELKRDYLRFVVPMTIAFMVWYLLYVVASNWAGDFMNHKLFGNINVALVWGLLQFATTFGIAWWYASFAARRMDPIADRLRHEFEEETER